jgi:hypothetical protein
MAEQSNGKGDKARNNFSQEFRNNHDDIDWSKSYKAPAIEVGDKIEVTKRLVGECHDWANEGDIVEVVSLREGGKSYMVGFDIGESFEIFIDEFKVIKK